MLPTVDAPAQIRHTNEAAPADLTAPPPGWREVSSHRVCAPEHAAWVERACLRDRAVLPRFHQQDRRCHRRRGAPAGGLHEKVEGSRYEVTAPPGAYAGVECWRSREHWLTVVVPIALDLSREKMVGRASRELMVRYLRVRSGYAAERTGRHCIVRPSTIASVLQTDIRTVQRCQAVARDIGLEHVVMTGRMLNDAERKAAQDTGSTQRGLSTEVAFTTPRWMRSRLWTATPSRGPLVRGRTSPKDSPSLSAASGETKDAASPRPVNRRRQLRRARHLASELVQIVPWLAAERPGRLAPALARFARCEPSWTAQELSGAMADVVRRRGHDPAGLSADRIRTRPAVVMADLLRDLHELVDHPRATDRWARPARPAEPCGRPGCDGHGWLDELDDAGAAVPCPHCPPAVRANADGPMIAEPDDDFLDQARARLR